MTLSHEILDQWAAEANVGLESVPMDAYPLVHEARLARLIDEYRTQQVNLEWHVDQYKELKSIAAKQREMNHDVWQSIENKTLVVELMDAAENAKKRLETMRSDVASILSNPELTGPQFFAALREAIK